MRKFWLKQGKLLLENRLYAYILVLALPFIPIVGLFSLSIMALITLRRGMKAGLPLLLAGIFSSGMAIQLMDFLPDATVIMLLAHVGTYVLAGIHRKTASWTRTGMTMLVGTLSVITFTHILAPEYILRELQDFLLVFNPADQNAVLASLPGSQATMDRMLMAHYLLGIKFLAILVEMLSAVLSARYIQSLLFNPGGFQKELLDFRANRLVVLLMCLSFVGAYYHIELAASALLLVSSYLVIAGVCLSFSILLSGKNKLVFSALFLSLILAPHIMLPVYVIFGCLDSFFDFRLHLLKQVSKRRGL